MHTRNELIPLSRDSNSYGVVGANDPAQETIDTLLALNRRYPAPGGIIAEDRLTAYKKTLTAHVAEVIINSRRHHSPSLF